MPQPISSSTAASSNYSAEPAEAAPRACTEEAVGLARAGAALTGSIAALVAAAPTVVGVLPGIAAFVGASMYTGQALANYLDCQDAAATKAE